MDHNQSLSRGFQRRSWGPKQIARLRVGIGVWLLLLTAILYSAGVGGAWELVLVAVAAVHFVLASRSVRVASTGRDRGMAAQ